MHNEYIIYIYIYKLELLKLNTNNSFKKNLTLTSQGIKVKIA